MVGVSFRSDPGILGIRESAGDDRVPLDPDVLGDPARVRQLVEFGHGKVVAHWGGRALWQLADADFGLGNVDVLLGTQTVTLTDDAEYTGEVFEAGTGDEAARIAEEWPVRPGASIALAWRPRL